MIAPEPSGGLGLATTGGGGGVVFLGVLEPLRLGFFLLLLLLLLLLLDFDGGDVEDGESPAKIRSLTCW